MIDFNFKILTFQPFEVEFIIHIFALLIFKNPKKSY